MKLANQLPRLFAPLALAAFAAAAPSVTGAGAGQWTRVSPRAIAVQAVLSHRHDRHAYALDALLIGSERGQIFGRMSEMIEAGEKQLEESLVHLELVLQGDYIDLGDGTLYVRAQISLDFTPLGGELVAVGVLDGQLRGAGAMLGGYCGGALIPPQNSDEFFELDPAAGSGLEPVEPVVKTNDPQAEPLLSGKFTAQWLMF